MRGGAIPVLCWGGLLLVLFIGNWIWDPHGVDPPAAAFGAVAIFISAGLIVLFSGRRALRRGPPEPDPAPQSLPGAIMHRLDFLSRRARDVLEVAAVLGPGLRLTELSTILDLPASELLTVIREAKRYKADLPVIIITGFSTESSAIEAVNLGVAGYLTKPFRVPQVLAAAAKALGE